MIHRVLGGEEHAHAGPEGSRDPEAECECAAVKRAAAQLGPDHQELAECRVDDRVVEMGLVTQDEATRSVARRSLTLDSLALVPISTVKARR